MDIHVLIVPFLDFWMCVIKCELSINITDMVKYTIRL